MSKSTRLDSTRTDEVWTGLNEVFDLKNVEIINKLSDLKDYRIIHTDEIETSKERDFFVQFVTVPITNGKEKALLVSDLFKRVPDNVLENFGENVYLTSYKECLNLIRSEFVKRENKVEAKDKNAIEYIKEILTKMELLEAADLNLSWTRDRVIITYSVNGKSDKKHEDLISLEFGEKIKTSLVNMAYENNSEKIIDGKFFINILNKQKEYRLSVVESIAGNSIAIRSYEKFNVNQTLEDLGYTETALKIIYEIIENNPFGIFLITGKTGTGKTTTIYTILNQLYKKYNYRIKTAEDPVELEIDGIDQCQINKKGDKEKWVTYLRLLASFLRQKPDIITIGEIRDKDVALAAIEASLTGHNVITTLHTNNVKSTFTRLMNTMEISEDRIEDSMSGVLNQILLPKLCSCKIKNESTGYYERNKEGCPECEKKHKKGYLGVVPIVEIASLKKGEKNYLKENYINYYSHKDCAKDLLVDGTIDEIVFKEAEKFGEQE